MPSHKLFIGFRTKLAPGAEKLLPEFKAPANFKDPEKIAAEIKARQEQFLAEAKDMPYTGTLDEVYVIDYRLGKLLHWSAPAPGEEKPPVSLRLCRYFKRNYAQSFTTDIAVRKTAEVVLVGFNVKLFLKIVGIECSLPAIGEPCPPGLWYGNSDHRDIGEAIMPKDFTKGMTLPYVLGLRRPQDPETGKNWDAMLKDWKGPGENPKTDALLSVELATQLGFLAESL